MRLQTPALTSREIWVEIRVSALPNTISRSGGRLVFPLTAPQMGKL